MPHYRMRPTLVARGVQPVEPDRRLPCRPIRDLAEALTPVEDEAKVDVNEDADERENADKSG